MIFELFEKRNDLKYVGAIASIDSSTDLHLIAGQVEVTTACSQRCRYCSSWREAKKRIDFDVDQLLEICSKLAQIPTFRHLTLTGGDPQNWPHLNSFLKEFEHSLCHPFALQISTAMQRRPRQEDAYCLQGIVDSLRVSLDAITPLLYKGIRGVERDPRRSLLPMLRDMKHPNLSFICTIYPETAVTNEIVLLTQALCTEVDKGLPIRKLMLMSGIGAGMTKELWNEFLLGYFDRFEIEKFPFEISIQEDPWIVRDWCHSENTKKIPCRVGKVSFHIKADGAYYPCCLVGGEAIETDKRFCCVRMFDGNDPIVPFSEQFLSFISGRIDMGIGGYHYNDSMPCKEICQFKQAAVNYHAELAKKGSFRMP